MTESEFPFSDLLHQFDDPESPDRQQSTSRPIDFDDDEDDEDELTPSQKMFGIYEEFFTPEERKQLAAIPENDLSYEINLLRSMLAETFIMFPTGPRDKQHPMAPKFQYALITVCCRSFIILTRLAALHVKLNGSRNKTADLVWEALGEMDPDDLDSDD